MALRDDLHALVEALSDDQAAAALASLRVLAQRQPATAQERLAHRMGPAMVSGHDVMTRPLTSLADLAAAQDVRPIASADALRTDLWPADPAQDPDLFCATLREWRRNDGYA